MMGQAVKFLLVAVLVGGCFSFHAAEAAPKKGKQEAQSKKKKKTVAELLAQMKEESRGGKAEMKKGQTALPDSDLGFQPVTPRNLETIKPPRTSEIFQAGSGLKAEYENVLDQQIAELYKLTRQYKDGPNRGELWLRLAELYVEKAAIIDLKKQEQYDRDLRAFQAGKLSKKPRLELAEAREYNRKSLQLYEWFARDFPRDSKIAQALFFLGYNHFELGQSSKGVQYYQRLVKEYPKSPFVMEAYFALGEFYFENDKWADAYKGYSPIIKVKKHPLHTFALYKGAWALYRLGKHEQALKYLEYIIRAGKDDSGADLAMKKAVNRSKLETEALRDLVIFYAAIGSAEKAESYFSDLMSGDITPHMEKLASFYSDRGNKDSSSYILKALIAKNPSAPKAYNYQYQIVQNYFYAKNSSRFKEELYRWIKDYDQNSSWFQANNSNKELIDNSNKLRETTLKKYALQQHQTAQNSRSKYSQGTAIEAYQLYITSFPSTESTGDMHFYYGELLYDMEKFDEAATQYNWVVQNAPKNKFFNKAAVNLIHAVEKNVPTDKELASRVGSRLEPLPLDPKVEKFISAGKWYVQNFPQSDKNPEILFRVGRLYYQSNHFDEANEVFKSIVHKHPRSKHAEYSANLILDIYSLKKDYVGLERTGQELLANPAISDSKAGADIRGVLEKASFKKAQDLEVNKNYAESAAQFEKFAVQNPKSELATQAMFNAAVNYERSGQNQEALTNYSRVAAVRSSAHKDLKAKALRLSAKLHQNAGHIEAAADQFKQVARTDLKDPLAANLLFTAAALYEVAGRDDEAIRNYNEFAKLSKRRQDKIDATYLVAQIYRKQGRKGLAVETFKQYLDESPSDGAKVIEAQYWLMEITEDQRKIRDRKSVV